MLQHLHYHWLNGWHFDKWKALLQQLLKLSVSVSRLKRSKAFNLVPSENITHNHKQPMTHLSSSFPSAMVATRSISFSRSSSKTDWWNSSRGVPWRSRKGRADWRVGSRMPFSICRHVTHQKLIRD